MQMCVLVLVSGFRKECSCCDNCLRVGTRRHPVFQLFNERRIILVKARKGGSRQKEWHAEECGKRQWFSYLGANRYKVQNLDRFIHTKMHTHLTHTTYTLHTRITHPRMDTRTHLLLLLARLTRLWRLKVPRKPTHTTLQFHSLDPLPRYGGPWLVVADCCAPGRDGIGFMLESTRGRLKRTREKKHQASLK